MYRRIDKTVKTQTAINVYTPHKELCLCCFLTVSGLTHGLLQTRVTEGYTQLPNAARKKKATKITFFPLQSLQNLAWVSIEGFSLLENVSLVQNIESWPQEHEKCRKKKFELKVSVYPLFFVVYYWWPLVLAQYWKCFIHLKQRGHPCFSHPSVCVKIELVTVFDAILKSRQTREKLHCLYENLMSNNFRRTAVLKKYDL